MYKKVRSTVIKIRRIDGKEPSGKRAGNRDERVRSQKGKKGQAGPSNRTLCAVAHIADVENPCGGHRRSSNIEDEIKSGVENIILHAGKSVKKPTEEVNNDHPHIEKNHCVEHLMLRKDLFAVVVRVEINHEKNNQRNNTNVESLQSIHQVYLLLTVDYCDAERIKFFYILY